MPKTTLPISSHVELLEALISLNADYKEFVTNPKERDGSQSSSITTKEAKETVKQIKAEQKKFKDANPAICTNKNEAEITILMNSASYDTAEFREDTKYAKNLLPKLKPYNDTVPAITAFIETAAKLEKLKSNFNLLAHHMKLLGLKNNSLYTKVNQYLQRNAGLPPDTKSKKYQQRIYQGESYKLFSEYTALVDIFYQQRDEIITAVCKGVSSSTTTDFWNTLSTSISAPHADSFQKIYEAGPLKVFVPWFVRNVLDPSAAYLTEKARLEATSSNDITFGNPHYLQRRKAELAPLISATSTITESEKTVLDDIMNALFTELNISTRNSALVQQIETQVLQVLNHYLSNLPSSEDQNIVMKAIQEKIKTDIESLAVLSKDNSGAFSPRSPLTASAPLFSSTSSGSVAASPASSSVPKRALPPIPNSAKPITPPVPPRDKSSQGPLSASYTEAGGSGLYASPASSPSSSKPLPPAPPPRTGRETPPPPPRTFSST